MAEFCLKCWNEINETNYTEDKYIMSEELDLCEGCGEYKHVIVAEKSVPYKFSEAILSIFKKLYKLLKSGILIIRKFFKK